MNNISQDVLEHVDHILAVDLTQQLVKTPSVLGEEGAIGDVLARQMTECGLQRVQKQEVAPGRYNVIGELDFGPGPEIVLTGHMDTKPVSHGWDQDPYGGTLVGNRLYGHGIMDMKAGLACQIAAAASLARVAAPLSGKVTVVAVCDHMGQQAGSRHYFIDSTADMAILGELTDNKVAIGHRGRYYWDVTTLGRSAHTCHKHDAINALTLAAELVLEIEQLQFIPDVDGRLKELFGEELYIVAGRIYGGLPPGGPSMIPDECVIRIDSRPHPGVKSELVREVIEKAISRVKARNEDFRYDLVLADEKSAHLIDQEAPIVRYIRRAAEIVQGGPHEVVGMSWLGDTASFGAQVPTVIFGPGREPVYMANEYLEVGDIHNAASVYALTAAFAMTKEHTQTPAVT